MGVNVAAKPVNAIKGRQGFQRTGRADPLQAAALSIPALLTEQVEPATAPPNYTDVHGAYLARLGHPWHRAAARRSPEQVQQDRLLVAETETPLEQLSELAGSHDAVTLAGVARHRNVDADTLYSMASRLDHEDYEDVICRIGERDIADARTMALLANSKSEKVKVWAAWHDNTPASSLAAFRDHPDAAVRQGTAENPSTPDITLLYMGNALYEGDGPCRTAAKANPNYPSVESRLALAVAEETPAFEREMLCWDSNAQVRKSARSSLGNDRPTAEALAAEARRRRLPRHVVAGIARRKQELEDRTASAD